MTHDLVAWPGERPADAEAACAEQTRRMLEIGLDWYRSRTLPDLDPSSRAFAVQALLRLPCNPEDPGCPWRNPRAPITGWNEMLAIRLDGPRPAAIDVLARLAEEHGMVLFDLHAHRILSPGEPSPGPRTRKRRCEATRRVCEQQRVLLPRNGDCSHLIDPLEVVPFDDELTRFHQVARMLDARDLEEVRERLSALLDAGHGLRAPMDLSA